MVAAADIYPVADINEQVIGRGEERADPRLWYGVVGAPAALLALDEPAVPEAGQVAGYVRLRKTGDLCDLGYAAGFVQAGPQDAQAGAIGQPLEERRDY
jgi:hypothetical protein